MRVRDGRRRSIVFFISFGACLVALTVALNVGWIILNLRAVAMLVFGIIFFIAIIVGLVLNTTFLVREIRRNEQQDSFLNSVTHELKTPLASIKLYLETLQTREVDEARRQEFYRVMLDDSNRLMHTVDQVLRAGHLGQRQRLSEAISVDLGEQARECIEIARTRYHLAIDALRYMEVFKRPGERATVRGNPDELRTAISNLIDNAVKYSDENVQVSVVVATLDERSAVVRVTDQGVGIPSSQLKRIFKRFYRVPGRVMQRVKGTGLGLFIVRSIVDKHGGRVFAESLGEGHGSTFTIQLPRIDLP